MKKYNAIFVLCFVLMTMHFPMRAQFLNQGSILFERTINLKQYTTSEREELSSNQHQTIYSGVKYSKAYFSYKFNAQESLYTFIKNDETYNDQMNISGLSGKSNTVYSDYNKHTSLALKNILSTDFIIADSIHSFQWKIQDEFRPIAGYLCRKATTIIFDSVVVVAFYTTSILSNGGPESFGGLPGMILGIAIPRLNTTWYATEVSLLDEKIIFKSGQKETNYKAILDIINKRQPVENANSRMLKWWVFL